MPAGALAIECRPSNRHGRYRLETLIDASGTNVVTLLVRPRRTPAPDNDLCEIDPASYSVRMSQKTDADHVLPPKRFTGELAVDGQRIPVRLTAHAGPTGRLQLAVDPIPTANSTVGLGTLIRSLGRPGNATDELALECESSDGSRLTSESAYLASCNRNSEGLHIELRTHEASLTMTAPEACPRPTLRFLFLGFACYPPVQVPTAIGSVIARGTARAAATDEIAGFVAAETGDDCLSAAWRASAEHMLKHLRSVLAFSRGAPLPVPIVESCEGRDVEITFYETSGGFAPEMPPLPHLNLQPIVTTAITNIENVDAWRDAFEMAVGWLLVPTTIDEVRFLSGMTALESVTARSLQNSQKFILRSPTWKRLNKGIRAFLDEQEDISVATRGAIKRKIPELNRRPFIQQIEALLETWQVARTSIEPEALSRLVCLRNKIVHRGAAQEDTDLWPSILLIREIVVRLVLSMLGFEGTYQCYLGGHHVRRFPDCKPVD